MAGETSGSRDLAAQLVEYTERGEVLDFAPGREVDKSEMPSWNGSRTIPASVIRDIMRERVRDPDPHGLRLRAARIAGRLDLLNVKTAIRLDLVDCFLEEGLDARDARLPALVLTGCRIESHTKEPAINAHRLDTGVFALGKAKVVGGIHMIGAHIHGQFNLAGAHLTTADGPALSANGLHVDHSVYLRDRFTATGVGEAGAIRLTGATIAGVLDCSSARLTNHSGPAMSAWGLRIGGGVLLRDGFYAKGDGAKGAVRLRGADIGGELDCSSATLHNETGPALDADSSRVGHNVFMRDGFHALVGSSTRGALRLLGAEIRGEFDCSSAHIVNTSGPAVDAYHLNVEEGFILRRVRANGASNKATLRLLSARIGGQLDLSGARLTNDSGPALLADGLQADRDVLLGRKFCATGADDRGAVLLRGAHVGGDLECSGATITGTDGPALDAKSMRVDRNAYLVNGSEATCASGLHIAVRLTGAQIGGTLEFSDSRLGNLADQNRWITLDGLTYSGLPTDPKFWLEMLENHTDTYAAQPYQHLAAAHRAAGHDSEVRSVLIAQQRDRRLRGQPMNDDRPEWKARRDQGWARFLELSLGYGYQPWRALVAVLGVVAVALILALTIGSAGGGLSSSETALGCSTVDQIAAGLDLAVGLPLLDINADGCAVNDTTAGQALTSIGWVLQVLTAAFATLFVAGFTRIVRKA